MSILKFLGYDPGRTAAAHESAETETVRKIVAALDRLEPDRARHIAIFAYILSRVARADLVISEAETRAMESIVEEAGELTPEQAILVVQMAKTQAILFGGTENYIVTREFNRLATREEKLALLRCLFAVSASDDSISVMEDNEIRRIADELRLTHEDFIEVRSEFRDRLSVLRKPPEGGAQG
ncbi:MAG TPA: TerB family tellurite resistance protein [Candidatus Dormibacteraeota bacterium]|nr:TerB family tellurite resistance protein [Candidatus Dormibacteraeota bacterium]